ncbi:MAG: hypothetical protein ACP5GO_05350 [Thermoprotei archaeon]
MNMAEVQLVERDSEDGKLVLRLLISNRPREIEVYRVEGNMLDVTIDESYRTRFWFPFLLSDKKMKCSINNRAVLISLYR